MGQRWGGFLSIVACAAFGQQAPAPGAPDAVFRTSTKLVQVSVIAQDKQGKPIPDLKRDEFQIFDNGSPRNIQLFLAETEKPSFAAPQTEAPDTFTNRIATPAGSHSGYSVILIDNLFTDFGDPFKESGSGNARVYALRTLQSIPMGERIAIYALQRKLQVICEFTSDRDLLERQLGAWKPNVDTPGTASSTVEDELEALKNDAQQHADDPQQAAQVRARRDALQRQGEEAARLDALQRASSSDDEMNLVADHLAGIPGRKNLIWLSTRFVIGQSAIQKLNGASVSIYPVDLDGVCLHCPPRPKELMNNIAAQTGGVAYFLRNDLDVAMTEAMNDGRVSYTLGFYPPEVDKTATIHQLKVKVSRLDATLRYRTDYKTDPPEPVSANPVADLVKAMNRAMDATAILISATAKRKQDRLDLMVFFDLSSLDLQLSQGLWKGNAEIVARFTTATECK